MLGLKEHSTSSPETEPASDLVVRCLPSYDWIEDDTIEKPVLHYGALSIYGDRL